MDHLGCRMEILIALLVIGTAIGGCSAMMEQGAATLQSHEVATLISIKSKA